jgi:H+/Cl- antiporter ClcA
MAYFFELRKGMNTFSNSHLTNKQERMLQKFARFGLASKGLVYCLMGVLTVLAALGLSREKGDKAEAFKVVYEQPFGKFLLLAIALGLCGYVVLRVFQSFFDTERKGNTAKGIATRLGYAFSAVLYLSLIVYAINLASGNGSSGDRRQFFVSKVMEWPMGEWIIGIAALIIIGAGINQMYKGISKSFMKKVRLYHTEYAESFKKAGIIGYVSRGLVFSIVGYFLLRAAIDSNPNEANGTGAAFDFLQNNFGNLLMGIVALGLVAYGIFMFVRAKHENLNFS